MSIKKRSTGHSSITASPFLSNIRLARHMLDFLKTHVSSEISWNNYDCIEVFDFKKNGLGLKILSNVFPSMVSMRKICCS